MQKILGPFGENQIKIKQDTTDYANFCEFEKIKEEEWKKLKQKIKKTKGKLWNDPVYRLARLTIHHHQYTLYLGSIDFKTHYATEKSIKLLKNLPFEKCPNGMFISGYLETKDHYLVLGIRNENNIPMVAKISLLGGMLSPKEHFIASGSDLTSAFLKELNEETSLQSNSVVLTKPLGIYISDSFRVGVFLYCKLNKTKEEIMKIMKLNQEHKALIFWPKQKLEKNLNLPQIHPNIRGTFHDYLNLFSSLGA